MPLIERHQGVYDGWGTYFEDPNADEDEYGNDGEFFDEEDEEEEDTKRETKRERKEKKSWSLNSFINSINGLFGANDGGDDF